MSAFITQVDCRKWPAHARLRQYWRTDRPCHYVHFGAYVRCLLQFADYFETTRGLAESAQKPCRVAGLLGWVFIDRRRSSLHFIDGNFQIVLDEGRAVG
jgi:hypothetical protein